LKNILSIIFLILVVLVSSFLIYDAFVNNGNVVWSKAYWIITFAQISDSQWKEKYDLHPIVIAYKQKYPNTILTQDLGYTGKYLDYTVSNSTIPRLHIWVINDDRDHFYLKCENSFNSLPITVPMQVSDFNCNDKNAQYLVEQLFMDALKETSVDDLQVITLVVIKSKHNEPQYDNYCGFAHLKNNEVWFDADFAENHIVRAAIVDPPSPYCTDNDHSCFCDLQEKLTDE